MGTFKACIRRLSDNPKYISDEKTPTEKKYNLYMPQLTVDYEVINNAVHLRSATTDADDEHKHNNCFLHEMTESEKANLILMATTHAKQINAIKPKKENPTDKINTKNLLG